MICYARGKRSGLLSTIGQLHGLLLFFAAAAGTFLSFLALLILLQPLSMTRAYASTLKAQPQVTSTNLMSESNFSTAFGGNLLYSTISLVLSC